MTNEEEAILRAQQLDLIYSQSGILYEIIPEAPRPSHEPEKPNPGRHADGVVGSVTSPTVESLTKQLHQFSVKQSTAEATKASPSPQSANVFAQTSQKGNQKPDGKKKKGKKGEGNQHQNKPKPANNADGGKKRRRSSSLISCAKRTTLLTFVPLWIKPRSCLKISNRVS